jgi:hypothetical protein
MANNTETFIKYAVWGGALYLAYQIFNRLSSVGKTASDMADQAGELFDFTADPNAQTFASWYDPTQRTVFFYWLTFPDGVHHAVWSSDVNTDGTFSQDGVLYRIGTDKAGGLRAYQYGG